MLLEVNLRRPEQLIGKALILERPMKAVLQPFRVAFIGSMDYSITTLAIAVAGGVLPSTIQTTPGTGGCTMIRAMRADTPTIR